MVSGWSLRHSRHNQFITNINTHVQTHRTSAHMVTLGWCTKDLAPSTCSAEVRQRFLQPCLQSRIARWRRGRASHSLSSRASHCRRARVSGLPAPTTVPARVASELSMSCSSTGSHEDHDKRCADQAGSHAVHVDGRLRRPTGGDTRGVVENERGLISGIQAHSGTRRRRRYNSISGMPCRRASLRP